MLTDVSKLTTYFLSSRWISFFQDGHQLCTRILVLFLCTKSHDGSIIVAASVPPSAFPNRPNHPPLFTQPPPKHTHRVCLFKPTHTHASTHMEAALAAMLLAKVGTAPASGADGLINTSRQSDIDNAFVSSH